MDGYPNMSIQFHRLSKTLVRLPNNPQLGRKEFGSGCSIIVFASFALFYTLP